MESRDQPLPPVDLTQLAELARLTPAERFRRAVLSARNLVPFLEKVSGRSKDGPDEFSS